MLQPGGIHVRQLVSPETGPAIIQGGDAHDIISNDCRAYGSIRRSIILTYFPFRWLSLPTAAVLTDAAMARPGVAYRHVGRSRPAFVEVT